MEEQHSDPMEFEYTNPFFAHKTLLYEQKDKKSLADTVCNFLSNVSIQEPEPSSVLISPPLSPKHTEIETALSTIHSVDQNNIPVTPTLFPSSTEQTAHSSPTFIYHQAPIDHLGQSKSSIHYITGLFKVLLMSIVFTSFMYLIIQLTLLFRHDMKVKITSYESDLLGEQIYCQQQYGLNRCGPETRLPAVNHLCREWEQCMHRPIAVSKSQILAETLADMANAFSDGLTLKTMIHIILISLSIIWSAAYVLRGNPTTAITRIQ